MTWIVSIYQFIYTLIINIKNTSKTVLFNLNTWIRTRLISLLDDNHDNEYLEDQNLFRLIQFIYWQYIPYEYRPSELWYKLKCWAWYRYSTVKPKQLGHGWVDRSTLLPYCMFQILSDFLEKECSPGNVEWKGEYAHKIVVNNQEVFVIDEMWTLYKWGGTLII